MRKVFFFVFMALLPLCLQAQTPLEDDKGAVVGIKTNIPYWGTATPNLGVEFRLAKHWTLEAEVGLNPFTNKHDDGSWGKSLKHFRLHPEVRYWFCESFYGHFLGLHVPYLIYNVSDIKLLGTEDERHQGWGTGVGISYGYMFPVGRAVSLEAGLGMGFLHTVYEEYLPIDGHYVYQQTSRTNWVGPVRVKFAVVWRLWDQNKGGRR